MDCAVTQTPVVRSLLWKESDRTFLFYRRETRFVDGTHEILGSHWELPLCKQLRTESLEVAAERAAYDTAGMYVEKVVIIPPIKTSFGGNFTIRQHHYFALCTGLSGRFDQDNYTTHREGECQWISADLLGCYLIRRETIAMIEKAAHYIA